MFNLNPNKITLFKPYLTPSGNVGGYWRGQLDNMYGQVEPSCTVVRLDLWVVRFDLYSGKAAMDALLGHDHLSMRQKSHTLDRAASPSPILMFWFFYDDCIIINSANVFKSFCRVSILFLASWFACDACTITSPLTLHILWTLNHGVQICQTGQSLATAPYGHEQICNHDLLHTERNVQEIYT